MAVLRPRLRQVRSTSLDVSQRRKRRIPRRNAVEPPAAFVRLTPARGIDCIPCSLKYRLVLRRNKIVIIEGHHVIACISLGADEPGTVRDVQTFRGQKLPDSRVVGHLCECARVGPATPPTARAAIVGRFMRIVETDRSVSYDKDEGRKTIADTDIFQDASHDVRHLAHCES